MRTSHNPSPEHAISRGGCAFTLALVFVLLPTLALASLGLGIDGGLSWFRQDALPRPILAALILTAGIGGVLTILALRNMFRVLALVVAVAMRLCVAVVLFPFNTFSAFSRRPRRPGKTRLGNDDNDSRHRPIEWVNQRRINGPLTNA